MYLKRIVQTSSIAHVRIMLDGGQREGGRNHDDGGGGDRS